MNISLSQVFVSSENIIAREIEGELIIVPLAAGIGDTEDELYSLNDTGKDIWRLLDGKNTLQDVVTQLSQEYESKPGEIKQDVLGLVEELARRRFLVETSAS